MLTEDGGGDGDTLHEWRLGCRFAHVNRALDSGLDHRGLEIGMAGISVGREVRGAAT